MRKSIAFVFAFICLLGLAGCDNAGSLETDLSENLNPSVSAGPERLTADESAELDAGALDGPPELVVSTINNVDSVTASCGNYRWSKDMPDGMTSEVIACGVHPLDEAGKRAVLYTAFPAGSLPPLAEGEAIGSFLPVFYLNFGEIPPETVTARRWPSTYIGHADDGVDSEAVTVDISDGFTLIPMGDGEFVYEVYAAWGEFGSAYYVFDTLPQVRGET